MQSPWLALVATPLTPTLVRRLEAAALAIGRLDARVCASFARDTWHARSLTTGLAAMLSAGGQTLAEIDLFIASSGVPLPGRLPAPFAADAALLHDAWRTVLPRSDAPHWRQLVAVPFDLPAEWSSRPALLRALALTAHHAQTAQADALPVLPQLLVALGLTRAVLPCLAVGDPAWRHSPRSGVSDVAASATRMLRALTDAADAGLQRLHRIERNRVQAEQVLAGQLRARALRDVLALAERTGGVTPRGVAQACGLSLSGAGKLLARSAALDLLVEVSERTSWRTYLVPDLARQFGYLALPRGRPPAPALPPLPLDATLAAFDAEMTAIDALLARRGRDDGEASADEDCSFGRDQPVYY